MMGHAARRGCAALAAAALLAPSLPPPASHAAATPASHAAATPARSLAARAARFPTLGGATAALVQEREVSLVDDVLRARGRLALAAPGSFRLDLVEPEPMTMLTVGATTTVIDADGKATALPPEFAGLAAFARTLTELLLGQRAPAGFREAWADADTVTLTPASDTAGPFAEITLRFPPDRALPETIVLRERGGDRTTIRLHDVALDPPIDPRRFQTPAPGAN